MNKFLRKETYIGFSIFVVAPLIYLLLPAGETQSSLMTTELAEMDETFLLLFRDIKQSKLEFDTYEANEEELSIAGSDPFALPSEREQRFGETNVATSKKSSHPLTLKGILWDDVAPSAIINKKIVRVGSQIGSFRVAHIWPQEVLLKSQNNELVLKIPVKQKEIL